MSLHPPPEILAAFGLPPGRQTEIVGGGLIHASFHAPDPVRPLLLQRFASHVFPEADFVATNIRCVSSALKASLHDEGITDTARLVLEPCDTLAGTPYAHDSHGRCWRAAHWIDRALSHERASRPELAYAAAYAFADFQRRLQSLEPPLEAVLPGFHDTARRYRDFERAVQDDRAGRAQRCRAEIDVLRTERLLAPIFGDAQLAGRLPIRTVHNDAKIANLLFDALHGAPIAVVDLDTTGPGIGLTDLGDLIRSTVSAYGEQAEDPAEIEARPAWIEAVILGWRDALGDQLSEEERVFLPLAGVVMAYEQALRFLTDFLHGDTYYAVDHPDRNLRRCRSQIALLQSLHDRKDVIRRAAGVA